VRLEKQARWLSQSLIELGPTFIKIGQALGTRADLLPLSYVKELSTLQDQVPAFSTAEAFARIESELGKPLAECFAEIDNEPVASASLGQVYRARLASGEEVAVKVQRPDLEQIISFDVAAGATMPYQFVTSKSFSPNSRSVGTFGKWEARSMLVTASGRILPSAM